MKRRMQAVVLAVLGYCAVVVVAGEPVETNGTVDAVTVYRGQAYVTRIIEVPGPVGLRELVVGDLPQHIVPGSIYAESADGVEVRSVRYRVRPVKEDLREEVRELDDQLRQVGDQIETNQRHTELLGHHTAYLDSLEQFVAPTANAELTRGVLNSQTLEKLTLFLFAQRTMLAESQLELNRELRKLNDQQQLLRRQRDAVTGSSARTMREAVVFVNLLDDAGARLRLRYLVDQATWSPSYSVRTDEGHEQVTVHYYASVHQMSGEKWTDVEMTLSTATPSLAAKAPVLSPLTVTLASASPQDYKEARRQLSRRKGQVVQNRSLQRMPQPQLQGQRLHSQLEDVQEVEGYASGADFDDTLNTITGELQILDLAAKGNVLRWTKAVSLGTEEGISVSYALPSRTTLPSRSDRQLIQIAALPMTAEFYKVATPVLTGYVYEEAAITNTSDMVLLAGPVSTYVGGRFVGRDEMPTVAVGENCTLGFGIDPSLRAGRELVEKRESIQGGNRVVKFTYRLSLENFGTAPATVRLLDRIPQAKGSQVKIDLTSTGRELSDDPSYKRTDRKNGILRWEVEVSPQAIGPEAFAFEYEFDLEHDRQMTVAGMRTGTR